MQLAGRVAQRYLSTLPHGVSWVRIPLLACQSALRRCCPLLATLPARPPVIRRCCPSPHHPPCMPAGDPASLLLLLSFQAEHPPPGGRGGLDVANQGNRGPKSTRRVPLPPPSSAPAPLLPCTSPIPLTLHATRWPCGPAVSQYTAAWRVLGSNPSSGMSVGALTVLSPPGHPPSTSAGDPTVLSLSPSPSMHIRRRPSLSPPASFFPGGASSPRR